MRKIILLSTGLLIFLFGFSQDFSNKGKDFWVGYGSHVSMYNANGTLNNGGGSQDMVLYFTSDVQANVTVTIPATGWTRNYTIVPPPAGTGLVETQVIPKSGADDARLGAEQKYLKRGIHITSDKPIVAYAHIYNGSISGATLLFPTNTLGKEYYSLNYKQNSNSAYSYPYTFVIATEDSTIIQTTPSANTQTRIAGVTYTDTLMKGDILNLLGQLLTNAANSSTGVELTGTKIKSIATATGQCKKIAVFSGSGKMGITCPAGTGGSADNYIQQCFPSTAWGKKYYTVPTKDMPFNYFRVMVKDPATVVKLNGVVQGGIINNTYYDLPISNTPNLIEADQPIMVAQIITTRNQCGNNTLATDGDPEMIYLSSIEQTIEKVTLNSTFHAAITRHYINVIIKAAGAASFRLDNAVPAVAFTPHPQDPTYVYAQYNVSAGVHQLQADSGFSAIAYGYGSAESYGYNAGTNIRDLYNFITPINPNNISGNNTACAGTSFYFSITYPFEPTSLYWDFWGFQTPNVTVTTPVADTTYIINGRQVWRYKLPTPYTYNTTGNYPVSITAGTSGADGCGNSQTRDDTLFVFNPPVGTIGLTHNGCVTDTLSFKDSTNYNAGTYSYKWYWNFGDGVIDSVKNPKHKYLLPGTYTVKFAMLTNVGCFSDTATRVVTVTLVPDAKFGISNPVCNGLPVTFSDTSVAYNPGTLVKWYWDYGDGVRDTVLNNSNRVHTYTPWGNKTATLKVETNSGCQSNVFNKPFYVNPIPVSNFSLPAGICLPADSAHFVSTSTIADAATGFGYLWDFGDPPSGVNNNSALQNPAHYYNNAGPFTIKLITTSAAGCVHDTSKVLSTVYQQAIAGLTVNPENCLNDITGFTDNSNGSGNTVTQWFWDFGDASPINTTQNPTHIYATAGVKTIKHWVKTNVGCTSDTAVSTVTINPLPTANFTNAGPYCLNGVITFTDASVANAGSLNNWQWNFGDGNTSSSTSPTHIYTSTGPFTVTLVVTTTKGCVSTVFSKIITVQPLPVPSFTSAVVCLPYGSALFTNTSTIANSTAMTYAWNFGDVASGVNNTSALINPTHYFSTVGPYTVTLTATSVDGCLTTTSQQVSNIYPHPTSAFTLAPENCLNTVTNFTSNANGNGSTITEYHWDFGDGNFSTAINPTHTYATAGIKIIKHWIVTDKGCYSDTTQHTVTINPLPAANFTYTIPGCQTRVITFTDASIPNAGNLNNWQWNFGDATTGTGTPITHTYNNAGTYNVTLTVATDKGCISNPIANIPVVINARPLAGYIIPEVCLSDTYAQFLDTSKVALPGNISQWNWNFGDPFATVPNPNTSLLQNPQHSYTAVGSYPVQLIATSNLGCKDTIVQTLVINGSFPVANFTVNNPTTLCANDSVAIVNTSTVFPGTITKVEIYWDNVNFPGVLQLDDYPFSGKVYRHRYPNFQTPLTKTFTIRYRAYSGGVCVNDKILIITVNAAPKVQFNAMPAACLDAVPFQITQASEIGGVPGTFVYSGPGVSATGIFTPALAGVGTHTIKYTFTSAAAGCIDTISKTITVLDTAAAKFSFTSPTCLGNTTTFKEESTAPPGVTLSNTVWDFGDGSPLANHAPGSTFTHTFSAFGTYNVKMYNTSAYGCKSTAKTLQVKISPVPQTLFAFVQSGVCLPDASISFVNNSTIADGTENAFTYLWNFGDPASGALNTSLAKTPLPHLYTGTGPYTVKLTVTSDNNCVATNTKLVDFIHPQPKAAFDFNKPGVCIGDNVIFRDLTNGLDGTVNQWFWNFGDGITASTKQAPHLYTTANTYAVSLYIINSNGCNSDTVTQQYTVHPYPVADAGPDRVVLEGGSITILSVATGNDLQYLWTPNTYLNNTTIATPTASNMLDDITYTLTVTARGGCASSDKMFVKVLKAPKIPNTFTPNGDGINEVWTIEYLDTYPNNRVQVFTRTGQLVFESKGYKTPWNGKFNGKPLPFDTYYYIVEPESGRKPITGYVTIIK